MTLSRHNIFSSVQNHLRKLVASVKYYFVFISWERRLGMLPQKKHTPTVNTVRSHRFYLNVVNNLLPTKMFDLLEKRAVRISLAYKMYVLVSVFFLFILSPAICPIYYRVTIKNACNKVTVFDLFI